MENLKIILYVIIGIVILWLVYEFRDYIIYFINLVRVTFKNQKGIKDLQKEGMNRRNLDDKSIYKYIEISQKSLNKIGIEYKREFILDEELERHLKYSRFSEKYILELLEKILEHMEMKKDSINLKINYISSKYQMSYAGMYIEKELDSNSKKDIILNIQNDMNLDTIISVLAHECTHHLLLSNNIRINNRIQNECLTDITTILLGFGKYMVKGYEISNKIIYDEINHRSIKKDRVGYLSPKDISFVMKKIKYIK